jgi:FlaA1/EpsC-like NDP-sugar epimerase
VQSGVKELIINGRNGFMVDPDDMVAILTVIDDLLSDRSKMKSISLASQEVVSDRGLYIEHTVKQWSSVILSAAQLNYQSTSSKKYLRRVIDKQLETLPPPSKTPNGIGWEDRRHLVMMAKNAKNNNRNIYVWGASSGGRKVYESLTRSNIEIEAFVDSDPSKQGIGDLGKMILAPKELINKKSRGENIFVIVATTFKEAVSKELERNNFNGGSDYFEAW